MPEYIIPAAKPNNFVSAGPLSRGFLLTSFSLPPREKEGSSRKIIGTSSQRIEHSSSNNKMPRLRRKSASDETGYRHGQTCILHLGSMFRISREDRSDNDCRYVHETTAQSRGESDC